MIYVIIYPRMANKKLTLLRAKRWHIWQKVQPRTVQIIYRPVLNSKMSMIAKPILQQTAMCFESVQRLRANRELVSMQGLDSCVYFEWQGMVPQEGIHQM